MLSAKTEMFGRIPVTPTFWTWYSKAYSLAPPDTRDNYKRTFESWSDAVVLPNRKAEGNKTSEISAD